MGDTQADQAVEGVVGVGIGADSHAAPAVGADSGPVGVAALRVDLPAQGAVRVGFPVTGGDGLGGAHSGALGALCAEVDYSWIPGGGIYDQGQVGGDDGQPYAGAEARGHQQAHAADLPQAGIFGDQGGNHVVITVDMGAGGIAQGPDGGRQDHGDLGRSGILAGGFHHRGHAGCAVEHAVVHLDSDGDRVGVIEVDRRTISTAAPADVGIDVVGLQLTDAGITRAVVSGQVLDEVCHFL